MTKEKLKSLAIKASWTFVQAFFAVLLLTPEPFTKVALIGAVAAGLSALKTFAVEYFTRGE